MKRIQIDVEGGFTLWADDPETAARIVTALKGERAADTTGDKPLSPKKRLKERARAPQQVSARGRLAKMIARIRDEGSVHSVTLAGMAGIKDPKGLAMYSRILGEVCVEAGISKIDAVIFEKDADERAVWTAGPEIDTAIVALNGAAQEGG